ncbi:MAG TPA: hypothetical protein VFT31_03135 [Kribbella sp.]|nr:hypothetical protein [Kribbella sp.]
MVRYDEVTFRPRGEPDAPLARYHQEDDLVWAEFGGGRVRRGSLVGTCEADGELRMTYCMVLRGGEVVSGRCVSTPELLEDGRILLTEHWERYGPGAATGISYLEQVYDDQPSSTAGPSTSDRGGGLRAGHPIPER